MTEQYHSLPYNAVALLPKPIQRLAWNARVRPLLVDEYAAISEDGIILWGAKTKALTVEQTAGLIYHELLHTILGHHALFDGRDTMLANVACDAVINHQLHNDDWELPPDGVNFSHPDKPNFIPVPGVTEKFLAGIDMTEIEVYDVLCKLSDEAKEKFKQWCDVVPGRAEALRRMAWEAEIRRVKESNERIIRKLSPGVAITVLPPPPNSLGTAIRSKRTHRTYRIPGHSPDRSVILPGRLPSEPVSLCILVDVSGSMSDALLAVCLAKVRGALSGRRGKVRVIAWDTQLVSDKTFRASQVEWPGCSGGGTALANSLSGVKADQFVVVSDLESSNGPPQVPEAFVIGAHNVPRGWRELK